MGSIHENATALRQVASELRPPVRSGQAASVSQDDSGPPFASRVVQLGASYDPTNPATVAPAWCYGLTVDELPDGGWLFVAFGSVVPGALTPGASPTGPEVTLKAGQSIVFPRGARRVFLRCDVPQEARFTWMLDRFGDKLAGAVRL